MNSCPPSGDADPSIIPAEPQTSQVLTLLFTDVVDSTRLKQTLGDAQGVALMQAHHRAARRLLAQFPTAREVGTAGDSFFLVFGSPSQAVQFALSLQRELHQSPDKSGFPLMDRIGIHVGEVLLENSADSAAGTDSPFGTHVDLCARVMSLAGANQIFLTRLAFDSARQSGDDLAHHSSLHWLSHGRFQLKGILEPVEVFQVGEPGVAHFEAPKENEKARRYAEGEKGILTGWRPAGGQLVPGTSWRLEERLGEGAFGEVWLGRHAQLREHRVFKFCFRIDHVRSLKREATLFGVLKERMGEHRNIVKLHDLCVSEPPYYLLVEHVPGKDLKAWIEGQGGFEAIPFETRIEILSQVAEGLAAAHQAGVIHRDIKPGNILIHGRADDPGSLVVKVADFGIGQVVSSEILADCTAHGFTETLVNQGNESTLGTLLYMAPELFKGTPASVSSDVYAAGILLYQLLKGDLAKSLTPDWQSAIEQESLRGDLKSCLASNPARRFGSMEELAERLRHWKARENRLKLDRRRAALATAAKRAALIAAFVAVFGSLIWWGGQSSRRSMVREVRISSAKLLPPKPAAIAEQPNLKEEPDEIVASLYDVPLQDAITMIARMGEFEPVLDESAKQIAATNITKCFAINVTNIFQVMRGALHGHGLMLQDKEGVGTFHRILLKPSAAELIASGKATGGAPKIGPSSEPSFGKKFEPRTVVQNIEGTAFVLKPGGSSAPVRSGLVVELGATLAVGRNSHVDLLADGEVMRVYSSALRIHTPVGCAVVGELTGDIRAWKEGRSVVVLEPTMILDSGTILVNASETAAALSLYVGGSRLELQLPKMSKIGLEEIGHASSFGDDILEDIVYLSVKLLEGRVLGNVGKLSEASTIELRFKELVLNVREGEFDFSPDLVAMQSGWGSLMIHGPEEPKLQFIHPPSPYSRMDGFALPVSVHFDRMTSEARINCVASASVRRE